MSTNLVLYMGQIEFTISTHFLSRLWMLMECDILILIYFILLFNSLFLSFVCFLFLHWFIYLFIYLFYLIFCVCCFLFVCLLLFCFLFFVLFVCFVFVFACYVSCCMLKRVSEIVDQQSLEFLYHFYGTYYIYIAVRDPL